MFELHYETLQQFSIPNLIFSNIPVHSSISLGNLAMLLSIEVSPSKLSGYFDYRTDMFSADFMGQMVKEFTCLLEIVVQNSAIRVNTLKSLIYQEFEATLIG